MVTLADIAKEVGTSINTVSRALRDCSDISKETKEKVKRVAQEMGYVPNKLAEFLRSKRSNIVSVIIASPTNPFFSISIEYILDYMMERDYRALITVKKGNLRLEKQDVVQCIQNGACGIISFLDLASDAVDYCEQNKIPLLLCGKKPREERVSAVYTDECQCGKLVAQEAIAQKAVRPCYVAMQERKNDLDDRGRGYVNELNANGVGCDIYSYDYYERRESQKDVVNAVRENKNDFIFCYNDEIALIVSEAVRNVKDIHPQIYGVDRLGEYLSYCGGIGSVGAKISSISRRCAQLILKNIESYDGKVVKEVLPIDLIRCLQGE